MAVPSQAELRTATDGGQLVDEVDPTYPRPLLRRPSWTSLDGTWDFALDPTAAWQRPKDVVFDRAIEVPFAPETSRSGIGVQDLFAACWYRRRLQLDTVPADERVLLHFGAVDYEATVWMDDAVIAQLAAMTSRPATIRPSPAMWPRVIASWKKSQLASATRTKLSAM